MMTSRPFALPLHAALLALLAGLTAPQASAQLADTRLGTIELIDGEMRFREPSVAFLNIPFGNGLSRRIAIHRGAEREGAGEIVYFYLPIFAFATHPDGASPHGHPLIHEARQVSDRHRVRFRLHTSDPGLREGRMRLIAYQMDQAFIHSRDKGYNDIRVEPVHLLRVIMRLHHRGGIRNTGRSQRARP